MFDLFHQIERHFEIGSSYKRISLPNFQNYVYNIVYSQAVTHPSNNTTQRCLTSVIGRELVLSTWYGRRHYVWPKTPHHIVQVTVFYKFRFPRDNKYLLDCVFCSLLLQDSIFRLAGYLQPLIKYKLLIESNLLDTHLL